MPRCEAGYWSVDVAGAEQRAVASFAGDGARAFQLQPRAEQLLEQVFDGSASTLDYFGRSLYGPDSDILAGVCRAFAQVGGCVDGMKRHQVAPGFPCSLSSAADASRGTFADIASAASHV